MKISVFSMRYFSHETLIKSMICGFALLASGQVGAPPTLSLYSTGSTDFGVAATWDSAAVSCPGTSAGAVTPSSTYTVNVCSGHTVTLTTPITVNSITVNGTLTLSNTLTVGGNVTIASGATINGSGALKFTSGNKTINISGTPSLPALDVSSMNTGDIISVGGGPGGLSITSIAGGTLASCSAAPSICTGTPFTSATGVNALSGNYKVTVVSLPPTNAPVDLNMNKPIETFATEIELK